MKRLVATALLLAALPALAAPPLRPVKNVVTENNASCEIGMFPAATLLLPHFEVDFHSPATTALNTIFTIINTSRMPQVTRVTIWTDLGFPASWFDVFLTGYDAQTISMYEIIARGNYPVTSGNATPGVASAANKANPNQLPDNYCDQMGGTIPPSMLERLQRILTTGERDDENCRVGLPHANAVGYVTVDVIVGCVADSPLDASYYKEVLLFDNVLTGDYQRINPSPTTGNYAGGNPLVHIRAIPEGGPAGSSATVPMPYTFYDRYTPADARKFDRRQPLPSTFSARWIEGGPTDFRTQYAIWREGVIGENDSECAYVPNSKLELSPGAIVRFDEHENATTIASNCSSGPCPSGASLPLASAISSTAGAFPPHSTSGDVAGWFWMSLDNGAGRVEGGPYSSVRPSQNWVLVQMYAEGRYAVDFDATALANGCTLNPPTTPSH